MSELLWGSTENRTFNRLRAEVLEVAVELEQLIGGVIAAGYGQSASTAAELQHEMLGRLPIPQRVAILRRLLETKELTASYAFVVPVVSRTFELRNAFAHSLSAGYDTESLEIRLVSMRKGAEVTTTYSALYLYWLTREQLPVVVRELRELYFLVAPDDPTWHES